MGKQNQQIDKATQELIEGSSIEQLKELAYGHVAEIAELKKVISDQDEVIKELHSALDTKTTEVEIKSKVVKIGAKKFKVNAPVFRLGAEVYKAEDLEENEELANELLKISGQGILTLIK